MHKKTNDTQCIKIMLDLYQDHNPIVSIIMATFNRVDYLERSIGSFLNQTYKDAELLIVDDGSTDASFEVVNQYIHQYEHIRYLKHSNRRVSITKNVGIMAASGQYLGFLDSDDAYEPDYIEHRVQFMQSHPEVDLLEGGIRIIGDPFVKDRNNTSVKIHLSECIVGATFFGKAKVFRHLGGFNKHVQYSEDSEFWHRAKSTYSVHKIKHTGYIYYRNTPDSICNSI